MYLRSVVALSAQADDNGRHRAVTIRHGDPLPPRTPWWGVLLTRVATRLAWGIAVAIALGHC